MSTKVGELPFLWVHNKNILFSEKKSKIFSKNIEELFLNKELSLKLSLNGKRNVMKFQKKYVISKWNDVIIENC